MTTQPIPSRSLVSDTDRLRHVLVVGKTGMGKSTFLRRLLRDDMLDGRGLLLIDPHGDLAQVAVEDVPRRRRNDLAFIDASKPDGSPGLNPLRARDPATRALVVSNVLATMKKLWAEFWGPRTEHVLRMVLLALMEARGATLAQAIAMLLEEAFRSSVLKQVTDEHVRYFWTREFPSYGKMLLPEVVAPLLNKLGGLLASGAARALLTKRRPLLDPRKCLDRGRIVVASLPKGRVGEDCSLLLGGFLLGSFVHAALGRADVPEEKRSRFSIVVDEIGSFATPPFQGAVSELRKYGVGLVLATQSLAGMDIELRAALLGNVGTLVAFRVGADDAELLSREFLGEFTPHALMTLDVGEHVMRSGVGRATFVSASYANDLAAA